MIPFKSVEPERGVGRTEKLDWGLFSHIHQEALCFHLICLTGGAAASAETPTDSKWSNALRTTPSDEGSGEVGTKMTGCTRVSTNWLSLIQLFYSPDSQSPWSEGECWHYRWHGGGRQSLQGGLEKSFHPRDPTHDQMSAGKNVCCTVHLIRKSAPGCQTYSQNHNADK